MWFTLPHPAKKPSPPSFFQARPNTYKPTLPQTPLTAEDWTQRLA